MLMIAAGYEDGNDADTLGTGSIGKTAGGAATYTGRGVPRAVGLVGPLWQFVQREVGLIMIARKTCQEACDGRHVGAYLLETMPSVLMILASHADNPHAVYV